MTTPEKPWNLDDPDAPASEEELRAAEALRAALEEPTTSHEDADLARALALSHAPRELPADDHRAILERALDARDAKPRGRVIRVVFGAAAALSMAAAFVLVMRSRPVETPAASAIAARSTQPLFHEPFEPIGGTSARVDRIAMARASDLRDNRFARWGVP